MARTHRVRTLYSSLYTFRAPFLYTLDESVLTTDAVAEAVGIGDLTSLEHLIYYVLTPPSDISGLPYLLHQGELLRLWEPHKWILRLILGLGRDRYVFTFYHPCWLVTTPGVLISGHIGVGVIFSGRKGGYL